jgi:adenine-specific DNA-methyltransferase
VSSAPTQLRLPSALRAEKGAVYTKPWVVDLILDLVGYRNTADLAAMVAVEPAAGDGAFLLAMVHRLLASMRSRGKSPADLKRSIVAYELDDAAAALARDLVVEELVAEGVRRQQANRLARDWVVVGDYLLSSGSAPKADVVVGNPPYIRYDDLPEDFFAAYLKICPTMIGRCDIYVGFIEAGLAQLNVGGRLGFICADRWMRSAYGAALRRYVAENASVEAVIEMHDAPAFDQDVSAYPAVIVLRRGPQAEALVGSAGPTAGPPPSGESLADMILNLADGERALVDFKVSKLAGWYGGQAPWPWAPPQTLRLIKQLEAEFEPLENESTGTKVGIGVATGADKVFVTKDSLQVESDRLLPLAMVADTTGTEVKWSGHYLVDPWGPDGRLVSLADYPILASYFYAHSESLRGRNIAARHKADWYRTIDKVTHGLLRRHKLYLPDMKMTAHPVLDRGETYPHHNLYYIVSSSWDLEVLGGLLLSEVAEMFVSSYCVKMRGGTLRFQAQYLRRIRVPDPTTLGPDLCQRLRDAFNKYDRAAATAAALDAYRITALPSVA